MKTPASPDEPARAADGRALARLPDYLKREPVRARLYRLAPPALCAHPKHGPKAGGRPAGLQRVIVRVRVMRHQGGAASRLRSVADQLAYIGRQGAGLGAQKAGVFGNEAALAPDAIARRWSDDRHHFSLVLSPENGDRIRNLEDYTTDWMGRVARKLGLAEPEWIGACHYDSPHPHAHVLLRGRRGPGRDLVIPRGAVQHGMRDLAEEAALERLGDLSRGGEERAIWTMARADAFTSLDRRLLELVKNGPEALSSGLGEGGAWAAVRRARLEHLAALGLAEIGREARLVSDLRERLERLATRQGLARRMNLRRLTEPRRAIDLARGPVAGRLIDMTPADPRGLLSDVVIRDHHGRDHLARVPCSQAHWSAWRLGDPCELQPGGVLSRLQREGLGLDRSVGA